MSISVGMVGLGMFGPSFIQSYKAHPDVHRLALCDLREDQIVESGQNSLKFPRRIQALMRYANLIWMRL